MKDISTDSALLSPAFSQGKASLGQRDVMLRLLNSETFASAPRLRAVIVHLLEKLESGTSELITEQSIGQEVFGKPPGYNASEDNIVRVTIRHLRIRLDEFYRSEGRHESFTLVIPKGKYVPAFLRRQVTEDEKFEDQTVESISTIPADLTVSLEAHAVPDVPAIAAPKAHVGDLPLWLLLTCGALLVLTFLAGYYIRSSRSNQEADGILADLSAKGSRVLIVVVDSNLQFYRSVFGKQVSLENYLTRQYGKESMNSSDPRIASALHVATDSNDTNISSTIVASAIRQSLYQRHVVIKQPRDVSMREFQDQGNVLLLGGPWVNPWGQLFEKQTNFRLLPLPSEPAFSQIHNDNPRTGEPSDYIPHQDGGLSVNYVRIAILPNFGNTGHVFLLGATSTEALEAGGSFLLSKDSLEMLRRQFHGENLTELPPLEIVLEVRGFHSVPGSRQIVAVRRIKIEGP
jgi:hypothetical protein